ncbi:transcription antiterminator BglG [Pseudoclavibacter sp. RFBJ3]|uniref:PRD domain-containing protein n=1 Tax=unclassified Pseudoclavibacter TaxID=2615177 RepID=UPI000CE7769C|nr:MULTISPECIES: PRD domain-containing protein [unclassified Pseudoclavibacter]MBF4457851.1 PRD domain-containing protein [Pseudoclavibacter sp. VKM Ac-2867]MBF4551525.1 PRD domain-containing protein [Pseudoclavibacter sp. VKM Ac-2888]PPF37071.1 transcription antiterminator BglG [Pseudoclavibacter sp. AY1H1]PPF78492.1 transcription antiterminator BglG [Pseudoclavibacter sp. Z016]PPF87183.1 transcription antiterminator BglG [Pseudoclavibacter sp. RFBJ5]
MPAIKKVLNSSVVLVVDDRGVERVLLGKGIGYGQKPGDEVSATITDQEFISLPDSDHRNLVELLAQIPAEYVELTREIVADAGRAGLTLDPHVYLTLTDHLHFAVERYRKGIALTNRLAWEVRTVYPDHHAVSVRALDDVERRLGVRLGEEEAANVAFHLVNADTGKLGVDSMRVVDLVAKVTSIVTMTSAVRVSRKDLHASRFLTHLQFFAERFFAGQLLGGDDFLFRNLSERAPRAIATAERVRTFIRETHGVELPDEEVAFLAVHIARASPE